MHTRNVNVKTAAQESSRKMGEEQNPVSVAREWVAHRPAEYQPCYHSPAGQHSDAQQQGVQR